MTDNVSSRHGGKSQIDREVYWSGDVYCFGEKKMEQDASAGPGWEGFYAMGRR
jgi:hypothetical protein